MDETTKLLIATAMRKMFNGGYFSICTVDECLKLARIIAPGKPYQRLRVLHCVSFSDMPRELTEQLPVWLTECFGGLQIDELMQLAEPGKLQGRKLLQ